MIEFGGNIYYIDIEALEKVIKPVGVEPTDKIVEREEKIVLDPGLGFAKNPEHNWQILKDINKLNELNFPIYIVASRKRFLAPFSLIKDSSNLEDRDLATSVITTYSALNYAWAVRVHDAKSSAIAVRLVNQL